MGAAVGKCLTAHGAEVLTTLEGRSAASAARAADAGMRPVPLQLLAGAEILLSIVPPAAALAFAEQIAPLLRDTPRKPLFVDCNAVSPATVLRIAAVIDATGASFVDGGIIGPPPQAGCAQPSLYVSGSHAGLLHVLNGHGLDVRVLDGPVGAASALKLSFAGITKGFTAVATTMILAASRVGATNELYKELAAREPALLATLSRKVPDMLPKAYRWIAEMQEIAQFVTPDHAGEIYLGASHIYERVARAVTDQGVEPETLRKFFAAAADGFEPDS